jgi:DNA-binding transcriptional MerR regulator
MKPEDRKPYLKIGDVARLVGVSPSVIRSWESLGLTRPRRTASKYRLYGPEDVKLLKRARFLRRVRGLNAPAIVQLLKRNGQVRSVPDGGARAIGVRLRQLRIRRRLSLAQVAKAVGISVGNWRAFTKRISWAFLILPNPVSALSPPRNARC